MPIRLPVLFSRYRPVCGQLRWLTQIHCDPPPDWMLVGRLNPPGLAIMDYTLLRGGLQCIVLGTSHRRKEHRERTSREVEPLLNRIAAMASASAAASTAPEPRSTSNPGPGAG
jgi:hypothetical protein